MKNLVNTKFFIESWNSNSIKIGIYIGIKLFKVFQTVCCGTSVFIYISWINKEWIYIPMIGATSY